jgi:hypothetical protein
MKGVDVGSLLAVTPAGMLGVFFLALWRGWIVPGSTLDRLTTQWEARLREAHDREQSWKTAHDRQQDIALTATHQTGQLLESFGVLEVWVRAGGVVPSRDP